MPKPTDPYLLHSVFPGIFPHPKEIKPVSQSTNQPITYLEHLTTAQTALEDIDAHANPLIQATIAQAHALTAIALLIEELLGALDKHQEEQPYTIAAVGREYLRQYISDNTDE